MNRKKWRNPAIPLPTLALKLAEECGEVANVITDAQFSSDGTPMRATLLDVNETDHLLEELDHVIFIAKMIRERIA